MNEEKKMYSPIVNSEERYPLAKTSKANVAAVCLINAQRMALSDQLRALYADQSDMKAKDYMKVRIDKNSGKREPYLTEDEKKVAVIVESKKPVYEVEDIYNEYYVHAALAQVLFPGFPKIIAVRGDDIEILDKEIFNNLDEGVVNQAFLDFNENRNRTPMRQDNSLSALNSALKLRSQAGS
jgi:hypothetical protein